MTDIRNTLNGTKLSARATGDAHQGSEGEGHLRETLKRGTLVKNIRLTDNVDDRSGNTKQVSGWC